MRGYLPKVDPSVAAAKDAVTTVQFEKDTDYDVFGNAIEEPENDDTLLDPTEEEDIQSMLESLNYDPAIGNFSSPISLHDGKRDDTENKDSEDDSNDTNALFGIWDFDDAEDLIFATSEDEKTAKPLPLLPEVKVKESLHEAAMKAKQRNALPDSEFGLPRLRKYPLNDRKHVAQAIRMFGHVKIEEDRKTLAKAIIAKYDEFKMTTKVGKNNALYQYVPDRMRLEKLNEDSAIAVYGFEKKHECRNRKDIMMEHLRMNSSLFNNLFFNSEYADAVKRLKDGRYDFMNYFFPSFKIHTLASRMKTSIGGIYSELKKETAEYLKEFWSNIESAEQYCEINYYSGVNWYRSQVNDITHILWCLRLYDLLERIIIHGELPTAEQNQIMVEWLSNIEYHYGLLKDSVEYSDEFFCQCQYLHDMFWDPLDDPSNLTTCGENVISFMMVIDPSSTTRVNESGELIKKQDVLGYIAKELEGDDDVFLLPGQCQYPVLDTESVRLAMDCIRHIDEDDIPEYTKNLNRKYLELNCKFKITVDHPYAKYATDAMKCTCCMLSESDGNPETGALPKEYRFAESIYYNTF